MDTNDLRFMVVQVSGGERMKRDWHGRRRIRLWRTTSYTYLTTRLRFSTNVSFKSFFLPLAGLTSFPVFSAGDGDAFFSFCRNEHTCAGLRVSRTTILS